MNEHSENQKTAASAAEDSSLFRRVKTEIKKFLIRKIITPCLYYFFCLWPMHEDRVLFVEAHSTKLSDNFAILYSILQKNYQLDVRMICLNKRAAGSRYYSVAIRFLKEAARSKYVLFDDASQIQGSMGKRKGQVYVQMWHAAGAFKKFGLSTADKIFGENGKNSARYPTNAAYDLVTVSSPEICWAYAEAMGKERNGQAVRATGLSRTDVFFDPAFLEAARERVCSRFPLNGRRILLYAPTFRGRVAHAQGPDGLDISALAAGLRDQWVLLIKHHPFVKGNARQPIPEDCKDFAFDVSDSFTIEDLLCVSDLCITDYSSLIFEYSLFERPMVFFAYDLADYEDWRGFYYPYEELTPGPVLSTTEQLVDYIRYVDERFDPEVVSAFREKFMSACDGHATERILDFLNSRGLSRYAVSPAENIKKQEGLT